MLRLSPTGHLRYGGKGMDESVKIRNEVELRGSLADRPRYSHTSRGEPVLRIPDLDAAALGRIRLHQRHCA